jgi:signal peptidase II
MTPRALGCSIALAVFVADQASKVAMLSRFGPSARELGPLTPFLDLALRWNRGISFSLFARDSATSRIILLVMTLAAVTLLAWWLSRCQSRLAAAGLGAIIGGALGNAFDRIIHGAVVDFLDLHAFGRHFFVFNLADTAINIGVACLLIDLLFGSANSRSRTAETQGAPRSSRRRET